MKRQTNGFACHFPGVGAQGRRCRALARSIALLMLGVLMQETAEACTSLGDAGTAIHLDVDAWDVTEPDRLIASWNWAGTTRFLEGCAANTNVPINVASSLPILDFVRNVTLEGETYPAFGVRGYPASPLLVFRHWASTAGSTSDEVVGPLDIRRTVAVRTRAFPSSYRGSHVQIGAVSRGGVMQAVPRTNLGPISRTSPSFPRFTKTDTFSVTVSMKTPTCTLSNLPVKLNDVNMGGLPAAGANTGYQDFTVSMQCNGAFPLDLKLTDANAPANTGSRLTPTTNADAAGVRVELLRNGSPVVLGTAWRITAANGANPIALGARYYRETGTFGPGVVEGQAVITATYP